jgi:hypothetical protein
MPLRKILRMVCLILTALCLGIGTAKVGQWIALAAGLATLLVWLAVYKWTSTDLPPLALVFSVSLAAIGLCAGASPLLMLLGATLALANWDLAILDHVQMGNSSAKAVTLLEKKHFQCLLLALGLALLVMIAGRMIRFHIPFGVMIALVILAFLSLARVWRILLD